MLPSRSGRSRFAGGAVISLSLFAVAGALIADDKPETRPSKPTASPKDSQSQPSLTSIPLPIGREAKGLVLPDFDLEGRELGRLEAASAKRLDLEHVQFTGFKLTTFKENNQTDLVIDMSDSVLDLKTKVLSSRHQTTINRADFQIVGDTMKFDTVSRKGTMVGHVKMVVTGHAVIVPKQENE